MFPNFVEIVMIVLPFIANIMWNATRSTAYQRHVLDSAADKIFVQEIPNTELFTGVPYKWYILEYENAPAFVQHDGSTVVGTDKSGWDEYKWGGIRELAEQFVFLESEAGPEKYLIINLAHADMMICCGDGPSSKLKLEPIQLEDDQTRSCLWALANEDNVTFSKSPLSPYLMKTVTGFSTEYVVTENVDGSQHKELWAQERTSLWDLKWKEFHSYFKFAENIVDGNLVTLQYNNTEKYIEQNGQKIELLEVHDVINKLNATVTEKITYSGSCDNSFSLGFKENFNLRLKLENQLDFLFVKGKLEVEGRYSFEKSNTSTTSNKKIEDTIEVPCPPLSICNIRSTVVMVQDAKLDFTARIMVAVKMKTLREPKYDTLIPELQIAEQLMPVEVSKKYILNHYPTAKILEEKVDGHLLLEVTGTMEGSVCLDRKIVVTPQPMPLHAKT